jgi:hypothetical protein
MRTIPSPSVDPACSAAGGVQMHMPLTKPFAME